MLCIDDLVIAAAVVGFLVALLRSAAVMDGVAVSHSCHDEGGVTLLMLSYYVYNMLSSCCHHER